MRVLLTIVSLLLSSSVFSIEILELKNTSEWVATVTYEAEPPFNSNEVIKSKLQSGTLTYKVIQEECDCSPYYATTVNADNANKHQGFLIVRDQVFKLFPKKYTINFSMNKQQQSDGTSNLQLTKVHNTVVESEIKLKNNEAIELDQGVIFKSESGQGPSPELIGTIAPQKMTGFSYLRTSDVPGKTYNQVILSRKDTKVPLAFVSQTENPNYGAFWEFYDGSKIFILNLLETKKRPEGMGSWCKSRTVVYSVIFDNFEELSDSKFQCYVH